MFHDLSNLLSTYIELRLECGYLYTFIEALCYNKMSTTPNSHLSIITLQQSFKQHNSQSSQHNSFFIIEYSLFLILIILHQLVVSFCHTKKDLTRNISFEQIQKHQHFVFLSAKNINKLRHKLNISRV